MKTWIVHTILLAIAITRSLGKLEFELNEDEPQIYKGAPPGVIVLQVIARDRGEDGDGEGSPVTYNILDVKDFEYFEIGENDGNIITSRTIDVKLNYTFELLVVALSEGQTEVKHVLISVVHKNTIAPKFDQSIYEIDILIHSTSGTDVIQVQASDDDSQTDEYDVLYHIQHGKITDEISTSQYFYIEHQTGIISIAKKLDDITTKSIQLHVIAEDQGSPKLFGVAQVVINLKNISAPRALYASVPSETSVKICWVRPKYGEIKGYNISYGKQISSNQTQITSPKFKNVRIESNSETLCYVVENLEAWQDYHFTVIAWNEQQIGFPSQMQSITTRPDLCIVGICSEGSTCELLNSPPGYKCHCGLGQYGANCEYFDPCVLEPCENFGKCTNDSSTNYVCECQIGFYGRNCTEFNPCAQSDLSPCENGATCISNETNTYECFCPEGYFGRTCDGFNPCISYPCMNAAQCFNVSNEDFSCSCQPGFEGIMCEINIDECISNSCLNNGLCMDRINAYECQCEIGFNGFNCQIKEKCQEEKVNNLYGELLFPEVEFGVMVERKCPFGSVNKYHNELSRECTLDNASGKAIWGGIDLSNCKQKGHDEAGKDSRALKSLTLNPFDITAEKLNYAVNLCEQIVSFAVKDPEMAENLMSSISNLMEINDHILYFETDKSNSAAERLVTVINWYTKNVQLSKISKLILDTNNIVVQITEEKSARGDGAVLFKHNPEKDISMKLPAEALRKSRSKVEPRVIFVQYSTAKFFRDATRMSSGFEMETYVIEADVNGVEVVNLTSPVTYTMSTPGKDYVARCAYWEKKERRWSSDGLETIQGKNKTKCLSSHLTAFTILIDPTPNDAITGTHYIILSYISYIGSIISLAGLILTILTYSLFRCLNKDRQGKILLNLCISMALMNLTFLLGALQRDGPFVVFKDTNLCLVISILLHYFLLTTLCWMCVEAVNMYKLLVRVFSFSEPRFMLKRCVGAWGVPAIVVGATVGVNVNYYRHHNDLCMLSAENELVYYISLFGPCCFILMVNLVVFIMVCKVLCSPRMSITRKEDLLGKHMRNRQITIVQIKGAFTVMVLLGVTWVFGAFAIGKAKIIFQYVFCVTNSLQGFLIFVIRCLSYPEARKAWWTLLTTGSLKNRRTTRPTIASQTNSNSLQYKPSQNGHNSVKTTNSDSTTSTLVFNNSCSWGRTSNNRLRSLSKENSKVEQKVQDLESLYARPVKRLDLKKNGKGCFTPFIVGTVPPPVPKHPERTLNITDLTSDSDVGMIDDVTSDEDHVNSPEKSNWILKKCSGIFDDIENNNNMPKNLEREREVDELNQSNKVILNYKSQFNRRRSLSSINSMNVNLKRHTSIILINRDCGDDLRVKSQSTPNISHDDLATPPKPIFPSCDISNCHTNIINIKLGQEGVL